MENTFPGFAYEASQLSAYLVTLGIFIISVKPPAGIIIRFTPDDQEAFRCWLNGHHVRDITDEAGTLVLNAYANQK